MVFQLWPSRILSMTSWRVNRMAPWVHTSLMCLWVASSESALRTRVTMYSVIAAIFPFHAWGDELLALLKRPAHVPGPGELRRDRELFLLGETPEDQLRAGSGGETVHLEVFRRKPRALVAIENLGDPGWVARERGQPQHEQDLT